MEEKKSPIVMFAQPIDMEEEVLEIRVKYDNGHTMKELSNEYGVVIGNIDFIVKRKTWKHI